MALRREGIAPGDRVAFAGLLVFRLLGSLARVSIVAEIRPEEAGLLWTMSPARLDELGAALARFGAVALIAEPPRRGSVPQVAAARRHRLPGPGSPEQQVTWTIEARAAAAMRWRALQLVGVEAIYFFRLVIVAAILTPEAFGVIAVAVNIVGVLAAPLEQLRHGSGSGAEPGCHTGAVRCGLDNRAAARGGRRRDPLR